MRRVKGPYEKLVYAVNEHLGSLPTSRRVTAAVFEWVKEYVFLSRERVIVPGFGTFYLRTRKPMKTTLPSTGEECAVPGMECLAFRPSKYCKRRV